MARRVVRTKTEQTLVRIARPVAWSGSLTTASLVTPRSGRSRWGEWHSPRLPPATRLHGNGRGDDEQTPEQRKTGRAVPAEPERGGHRRGRYQPFRGGARRPGGAAGARVRGLHGGPVPSGGLVGPVRRGDRGHGIHRRVLDTAVRGAGRTGLPGDAGGPPAHQERARPQDRRAGLPVAAAAAHLRPAVGGFPARRGDPALTQLPAAADHAGAVRLPPYPAYAEGADPDEREAPSTSSAISRARRAWTSSRPS